MTRKRSDELNSKELEAIRQIRNWIVHQGRAPSVRELQVVLKYRSPRSAAEILERLKKAGLLQKRQDGSLQLARDLPDSSSHARTIDVPVVGTAPCGDPLLAEENIEGWIPVSTRLAPPSHRYFLLHAVGDSMNRAGIEDGSLVLVRQQVTAENGDRVVALIDDAATIKVFHREGNVTSLEPRSINRVHKPIYLTSDFQVQGVVVATIADWEKGEKQ